MMVFSLPKALSAKSKKAHRGRHHPGHGGEHPVGKFLFPKLLPERLLRVEFGRLGRPAVPAHVLGHDQRLGDVGTRSVQDHDEAVWRGGALTCASKPPLFSVCMAGPSIQSNAPSRGPTAP